MLMSYLKEKCQAPLAFLGKKAVSSEEKDPESRGAEEDETKELLMVINGSLTLASVERLIVQ